MQNPIIIIGSSIAGITAAEAAHRQDPAADILVLSQDRFPPYYRLRVCEVLDNPAIVDQLALHPPQWYADRQIRLELDTRVAAIYPAERQVGLADGRRLTYRSLVIASGSQSFIPPVTGIRRPGVHAIWTLQDALDTASDLTKATRAVVIGGGLLGLEAAWHARRRGLPTTVIEKAPRLLVNQLDEGGSAILTQRVRQQQVEVVTGADVTAVTGSTGEPDSPAAGVRLADGRFFPADLVLVSIGVRANINFLEGSGIAVQRRICADERMQTSQPDIYAAGDAAELDGYWFGLWSVSRAQGQVAGLNAAGGNARFDKAIPPYLINTMDTRVAVQGDKGIADQPEYELDVLMDPDSGNYRKLVYRDGIFSGFMLVGGNFDFNQLQKKIGQPGPV